MSKNSLMPEFHTFRFTKANIDSSFREECFQQVISTDAFRRLESIHFLGSIDFLLSQGGRGIERRQTRFDHSLGVASLAKRFALLKDVKDKQYQTIVIGALLHDIGHAPLSHSLEPSFRNIFEMDHHIAGERILRGEVKLGLRLVKALERNKINNFEVMALISGVGSGIGKEIFSRAINVDTIEGIIRSASYVLRSEVVLNPLVVLDALATLDHSAQGILDEFWLLKDSVYSALIQSRKSLVADFLCKRYMEINAGSFSASYYYGTELELRRDHCKLFDALVDLGCNNRISPNIIKDGESMTFFRRRFYIDTSVKIRNYSDIDRRYLQTKKKVVFDLKKRGGDDAHRVPEYPAMQDLFR